MSSDMSISQSNLYSATKENLPATDFKTHRKNQFSFASPLRDSIKQTTQRDTKNKQYNLSRLKFRSPLRQQQIQDYNRIKSQLKRGIQMAKQNISINQQEHFVSYEEYATQNEQHKYQTQRLIFEIQKLHQSIYEVERNKNMQIQRLKQQYQNQTYLNMSTVRQTHTSQVQLLQTQLRKLKESINDKTSQFQNSSKRQQRQIKHLTSQNNRLNDQIRKIIQQKNHDIESQQRTSSDYINKLSTQYQQKYKQLQQIHKKQIEALNKIIQHKQTKIEQYLHYNQIVQSQNGKLAGEIEENRLSNIQFAEKKQIQNKQRYDTIKNSLQTEFQKAIQSITFNYNIKEEILQNQVTKLKRFLAIKNQDRQKLIQLHNQRLQFVNQLRTQIQNQNHELSNKLQSLKQQHLQQTQILKVKIAVLHQNDIQQLVHSYNTKIQTLVQQIRQKQNQVSRIRKNLYQQTNHRFQMRKKYSIQIQKLNAKVIKLRSGINTMELDMKEKLENQRSMMLLTSRSIIKQVESKTENNKFYEEQLRKLRHLVEFHQNQVEKNHSQVDEKIKIADQELERLSKKILQEKSHHKQTQDQLKKIIQSKNHHIQKLNQQLNRIKHPQFDNSKQIKMIEDLKQQIHQKNLQIGKLKDQADLIQKKISIMKAQIDQYHIQQSISQQQAKNEYQRISHQNMDEFKKFYEGRIVALEQDKQDLKRLLTLKQETITSLVLKYKQLQKNMKDTLQKIKRRSQLQNRVMNLGMDNNLVKNMMEIVKRDIQN